MGLIRNIIGLLFFIGILLPFIGFYPITFLIAWRQAENAKNWETTKCLASCGSSRTKNKYVGYSRKKWIQYGLKSRLEPPRNPPMEPFSKVEFQTPDPTLSKEAALKKNKEILLKRQEEWREREKKERENKEKYAEERRIFETERDKYWKQGTEYFSIFQVNGWRYWGDYGWQEICFDELGNSRQAGFETDCYINPENPETVVFYRELSGSWFSISLLVINTILLFAFLYLAFYLFIYDLRKLRKAKLPK